MAGHQAAAAALKAALGLRSACLTEQEYVNLINKGYNTPEILLDAREKSLEAILVREVAVDSVLAWQTESKQKQRVGKWLLSICSFTALTLLLDIISAMM